MSNAMHKFALSPRFEMNKESVWDEHARLVRKYAPINLGQGFPNFAPMKFITDTLADVSTKGDVLMHQYTRLSGHLRLVNAIARLYSHELGREIDAENEIMITEGAYGGLFYSIISHIKPGDEVILIEPFFECYETLVLFSEGVPVYIPLRQKPQPPGTKSTSANWFLDKDELSSLFNDRTKAIIFNTPHNPTGKVYTREELKFIANLCKKWNVLCIADEVYEWKIYDGNEHTRIASLPDMWERTLTICSAGKTFGITGWKIGWIYGSPYLINNLKTVNQNESPTPTQEALAIIIENQLENLETSFLKTNHIELQKKRDRMVEIFKNFGMEPVIPEAGYFMLVDWTPLKSKIDLSSETDDYQDYRFIKWMVKNAGVLGLPPSSFCSIKSKPLIENFVRICFVKNEKTFCDLIDRLKTVF